MRALNDFDLSCAIENLLVERNPRGMKTVQAALEPGYYLRAAQMLRGCRGTVLIGTGFPVLETYETDGPLGAIALYQSLTALGANPVIVCGNPLADALAADYRVLEISVGIPENREQEAREALRALSPELIISIERPGLSAEGSYFNMRGEDISARCACFDYFLNYASCPSIGIGDGGNEIGMGNVQQTLASLEIVPSVTRCDELLIADVSNWAALGLIAIIGYWQDSDLLGKLSPRDILAYLSARGSIDGVTRENTLTEDGLPVEEGEKILNALRQLTGFGDEV